jgi:hypothetical protein
MKRRLFTILSALSLLLFVAVIVMWVLSYSGTYSLVRKQPTSITRVDCSRGRFFASRASGISGTGSGLWAHDGPAAAPWRSGRAFPPLDLDDGMRSESGGGYRAIAGVGYGGGTLAGTGAALRVISAPHWLVALATAALPAAWLTRWQRERVRARRLHGGCCERCGYDLRATRQRCPECGLAVNVVSHP